MLALLATGLATYSVYVTARARDLIRLRTTIRWTKDVIEERLQIYTSGLVGGASLFAVNENPTREQFKAFAERLNLGATYPGIQGFGFARRVLPGERATLAQALGLAPGTHFEIRPSGEREEFFPIVYLEPLDRRNREAIGYDMFSEPVRHEAMSRARDEGIPAASGKVKLVQEIDPHPQAGFLVYVPVYRGGKVPSTIAERREQLLGFVYSPFRADDLFRGIFEEEATPDVHFEVYDGATAVRSNLVHVADLKPSSAPSFVEQAALTLGNHRWTLLFKSTPGFEAASYQPLVPWVAMVGVLLSLTLYAITAALARAHGDLQLAQAELRKRADELEATVAARTARLRETIAELELMSYSIVHDMRAPLRAIQSFGGILEEEAGPALPEQCRGYISRMKTAATRMDALIRDVLNYSKMVKDELPLYEVDVGTLVRGIIDTYPAFQTGAAEIHIQPELPKVLGNEGALTQCFSHLLSNALRYAKKGQKPNIRILGRQRNGVAHICVEDDGVGIPAELHGKVFGLFQRLDNSPEGTGIGLAIVRKATERMGGKVTLESDAGKGARFCLELSSPRSGAKANPKPGGAPAPAG